jgi:predicted transcriptional regulator
MTEKERILKLIEKLPSNATVEDVMDELYFKEVVDRGLADLAAGRLVTHEEAKKRLAQWLDK